MIIRLYNCDNRELVTDSVVSVVEVSSSNIFNNIIYDIINMSLPAKEIAIFENDKLVNANDILLIIDFINLDFTVKPILTKLYKYISDYISVDVEKNLAFEKLITDFSKNVFSFINEINIDFESNLTIDKKDVFSMMKLKPMSVEDNLLSKLCQYLNICAELKLYKLIVLVNLKSYMSNYDLEQLYIYSLYKNTPLLLLECFHKEKLLKYEQKVFIDEDFCDIMYS